MNICQKLIFILIIIILLSIYLYTGTIYLSDGNEEPHINFLKKGLEAISQAANSFGAGMAAGAAIKASTKLIPKSLPIGAKIAVLGASAAVGVIGKKTGPEGGNMIIESVSKSNSSSTNTGNSGTTTNTSGSSTNTGNSGTTTNTNSSNSN